VAFFDCHFFSDTLGLSVSAHVLLPQKSAVKPGAAGKGNEDKWQTLYLLHGLSDDHTTWLRRTSIERYAAAKNLAVVMPAGDRSFYQDLARGPRYWKFVSEELIAISRQFFPLSAAHADTFAAGLSMGGYGALRLGFAKPEQFAAVASLSGVLDIVRCVQESGNSNSLFHPKECAGIFGAKPRLEKSDSDLFHLSEKLAARNQPTPMVYVACGTEDSLLEDNRRFHRHLDHLQFKHTYIEEVGGHDWDYWDMEIQRVLDWLPLRR
jgi:putative tributyrin esterase